MLNGINEVQSADGVDSNGVSDLQDSRQHKKVFMLILFPGCYVSLIFYFFVCLRSFMIKEHFGALLSEWK